MTEMNSEIVRQALASNDPQMLKAAHVANAISRTTPLMLVAMHDEQGEYMLDHTKRTLEREINKKRPGHVNRREAWGLYNQARRQWQVSKSPAPGRTSHTLRKQAMFNCVLALGLARE